MLPKKFFWAANLFRFAQRHLFVESNDKNAEEI